MVTVLFVKFATPKIEFSLDLLIIAILIGPLRLAGVALFDEIVLVVMEPKLFVR